MPAEESSEWELPRFPTNVFWLIEETGVKSVKCLVFDAYGTLFDVHSIVTALERRFPGQGVAVSKAWRTRQLEYTWLRSLMDRYEDFWQVTESALIAACNALKLPLGEEARAELMEAYLRWIGCPPRATKERCCSKLLQTNPAKIGS